MGLLLVRAMLDGQQPFKDVVAHDVFPALQESGVPGMFVRPGLHHNVDASWATLYSG